MTNTDLRTSSPALGSSSASSISATLRKTLPLQARHSIFSKAGNRSRRITPATNPSCRPPPAPPSSCEYDTCLENHFMVYIRRIFIQKQSPLPPSLTRPSLQQPCFYWFFALLLTLIIIGVKFLIDTLYLS